MGGGETRDGDRPSPDGVTSGTDRDRIRRDLEAEIETHIEMRTEELIASGLSPDDARREAVRKFGDVEAARREAAQRAAILARRERRDAALGSLRRGMRATLRQLRRAPGHTALNLLIYAVGVGLTTSIFTMVDHVLLRPLPFPESERLVALRGVGEHGATIPRVSMLDWMDWREGFSGFDGTTVYSAEDVTVRDEEGAFWAQGAMVYGPFFETLGVPMEAGRPLADHDGLERAQIVVISHSLWLRAFGARTDLADIDITVNGRRVEVVGVVAAGHEFPGGTEVWVPLPGSREYAGSRNNINFEAVARLRPDVTAERARSGLAAIARSIHESNPEDLYAYGVRVTPLRQVVVGSSSRWLILLIGAVGFVLLTACANLAGLGLARARRGERETTIRLALGARRRQLVTERLVEHVLVAIAGGGIGIGLASVASKAAVNAFSAFLPRVSEVSFDARIAAFGLGAALAAGILAGLAPALSGSRSARAGLTSDARGSVRGGRGLPGSFMVGTEVAIAVTLLVGGALLLRSFRDLASRDLGYDPEGVLWTDVALTAPEYLNDMGARAAYWERVLDVVRSEPAVEVAGLGNRIPTGPGGTGFVELEGRSDPSLAAGYRVVSEGYFDAMRIPLLAGRDFQPTDGRGTERVALVNRTAAQRFWPGRSPIGQHIRATSMEAYYNGGTADWITVIGVVGDVRHYGFESDPVPAMFVLGRQMPRWTGYMAVLARLRPGAPPSALDTLLEDVRGLDRRLAVRGEPLTTRVKALLTERRLVLSVLGVFAACSVILVSLGIYGLVSFAVAERTSEIAVRAALGAGRPGLIGLMLGGALRVVAAGAAVGLAGAWLLRRVVEVMVVGVSTTDPVSWAAAVGLVLMVSTLAALLPSLRAARLDPVEALRRE